MTVRSMNWNTGADVVSPDILLCAAKVKRVPGAKGCPQVVPTTGWITECKYLLSRYT